MSEDEPQVFQAEVVPPTAEEIEYYARSQAEFLAQEEARATQEALRASGVAKLMALGLTEEEAVAIAGGTP